jgi:hypothetical protein
VYFVFNFFTFLEFYLNSEVRTFCFSRENAAFDGCVEAFVFYLLLMKYLLYVGHQFLCFNHVANLLSFPF